MRAVLDRIYKIALWCAAGCILAICAIVSVQVSLNILARIGGPEWSYTLPSYADFAGYFLAAASFFALGPTLRAGVHIRVNLVVSRLGAGPAWLAELASWIATFDMSTYALLAVLTVFFIVLGCFLDGISVVVLTTSIILPMVQAVGIDPLWFGIYLVLVVEMSQITPPVGFNLFVIQELTGIDILRVARAEFPFFLLLLLGVVLITVFPQIVTVLPNAMGR